MYAHDAVNQQWERKMEKFVASFAEVYQQQINMDMIMMVIKESKRKAVLIVDENLKMAREG